MVVGVHPTPTKLKLLRGNPGRRELGTDPKPEVPASVPDPPEFLNSHAQTEWRRIGTELLRIGLLTVADLAPLAAYCQAYGRWVQAEQALAKAAGGEPQAGLLIRGAGGTPIQSPLFKIAANSARDMVRYAIEFGLTPSARARIAAGGYQDPAADKFTGLLAG